MLCLRSAIRKRTKKKRDLLRKQQIPLLRYLKSDKLLTCGSHDCATTNYRLSKPKPSSVKIIRCKNKFLYDSAMKNRVL